MIIVIFVDGLFPGMEPRRFCHPLNSNFPAEMECVETSDAR